MKGRIDDGQVYELAPMEPGGVQVGEVVFVRLGRDRFVTHLVYEVTDGGVLIGNVHGGLDGWVDPAAVLGRVTAVLAPGAVCDTEEMSTTSS